MPRYYKGERIGLLALLLSWTVLSSPSTASNPVRLKDLAKVQMGQEMQLYGIGLAVGLEGSGDGRRSEFTFQMMANMMQRMNITVTPAQVRVRNVAAVGVTATLSPFDRKGSRMDVQVASLGDASSLQGGTLLRTLLAGPDNKVYVTASGPTSIGGFNLGGGAVLLLGQFVAALHRYLPKYTHPDGIGPAR